LFLPVLFSHILIRAIASNTFNTRYSLMGEGQVSHPREAMNSIRDVLQHKTFCSEQTQEFPVQKRL